MSEVIQPKCTFSPDEILTLHVDRSDETRHQRQDAAIDTLLDLPGVDITDDVVRIPVRKALKPCLDVRSGDRRILGEFLDDVSLLVVSPPEEPSDKVFIPDWLNEHGFNGAVYPHFQRWLNTQTAMNPDVAKTAIAAMALPFGRQYEKDARKVNVRGNRATAAGIIFDYTIYPKETFNIHMRHETADAVQETEGTVRWNWLSISTLGNCACMGVDGTDRDYLFMRNGSGVQPLYEMKPHNVDISPQSLSLLLGVSAVAYEASQYEGRESIFADAEWGEVRGYPKN